MALTDAQLDAVQSAFRRIPNTVPISPDEANIAMTHHRQVVVAACRDQSIVDPLLPIYQAIRFHSNLRVQKIDAEYPVAARVLAAHGADAVRQKLLDARENPAAREVLKTWLANEAREAEAAGDDALPPAASGPAPIHDTPLPPPSSATPPMRGSAPGPARSMVPPQGNAGGAQAIGRQPQPAPAPQPAHGHPDDNARGSYRDHGHDAGRPDNVRRLPSRDERRESQGGYDGEQPAGRVYHDDKIEVYTKGGRGAALRFSNAKDDRKENERHVVFAELAPIAADGKSYQWRDRKLTIMLNDAEVEQVILVLLGLIPMARFTAHGADKKKWFQIQNQPQGDYQGRVQVQAGDGTQQNNLLLNIFPQDVTRVTAVLLRGYKAMRNVSEEFAVMMLRSAARNYNLAAEVAKPQGGQGGQGAQGADARGYRQARG